MREESINKYGQKQKILAKKRIKLQGVLIEVRIVKTQGYHNKKRWTTMSRARYVKSIKSKERKPRTTIHNKNISKGIKKAWKRRRL